MVSNSGCPQGTIAVDQNGGSMWQFYAVQAAEVSVIRTKLLLRILVVDSQPFQSLLESLFDKRGRWEVR